MLTLWIQQYRLTKCYRALNDKVEDKTIHHTQQFIHALVNRPHTSMNWKYASQTTLTVNHNAHVLMQRLERLVDAVTHLHTSLRHIPINAVYETTLERFLTHEDSYYDAYETLTLLDTLLVKLTSALNHSSITKVQRNHYIRYIHTFVMDTQHFACAVYHMKNI